MRTNSQGGLYTSSSRVRVIAVIAVIALIALVTALIESVFWKVMAVSVTVVGIFVMQGLVTAFVQEPLKWRDDLLIIAAALLYAGLTGVILSGMCRIGLPFDTPGCAADISRRVIPLNFFFSLIGFLGPWLAHRFDRSRS